MVAPYEPRVRILASELYRVVLLQLVRDLLCASYATFTLLLDWRFKVKVRQMKSHGDSKMVIQVAEKKLEQIELSGGIARPSPIVDRQR